MSAKMRAAVLHKPLDMRLEEVEVPPIGPHDVLVEMRCVGVCGSDVHYYLQGRIADFIVEKPLILGHECSGEVAQTGKDVKGLKAGQRVVIEPGFTCGKCRYCRGGRYNLCKDVKFYGAPPYDGAFAEYVRAPAQNVFPMPENMTYEEAAMIEPLAVGMMAAKMGDVTVQDAVAILGAGPIGQMTLQAVKAHGVLEAYMTDVVDYRLDYAKKWGASAVINASRENVVKRIMELTDNEGVDAVIEASGAIPAILQSIDIVRPGGRIVLVGYPTREVPLALAKVIAKEISLHGIHRYANVFPVAIKAVASGKAVVKPFVTHRFPFERILEAFDTNIKKTESPMKVQIVM